MSEKLPQGFIVGVVKKFLSGQASILLILFSLFMGLGAILLTPREEEPQIVVPMADIFVTYPGGSPQEVENIVTSKLEKFLWQIDGVEYVYSVSHKNFAMVTVRFFVKEDRERSLVKLHNKIQSQIDQVAPGITGWLIKPVEIDDVPIVTFNLFSDKYQTDALRRVSEEVAERLAQTPELSRVLVHGGQPRQIRVEFKPHKLSFFNLNANEIVNKIQLADHAINIGSINQKNNSFDIKSGPFFKTISEVENLAISVFNRKLVRLRDVATITDSSPLPTTYTRIGFAKGTEAKTNLHKPGASWPSVTISVSKKKGTNAVSVAKNVIARMQELKTTIIPSGIEVEITRDKGEISDLKVQELLESLFFAILSVVALIAFTMGWREAVVVALAVPISFSLSLFVNFLAGYTINRVTLFALILSLGLVVDDPITNVDNIQRHILKGKKNPFEATLWAIAEVLPPVIMSTLAIIVSFLPMFFITGMMGPYMEPMAINVPMTVTFSTLCALTFVPWAAYHLLKKLPKQNKTESEIKPQGWIENTYRRLMTALLDYKKFRVILLIATISLLSFSGFLVLAKMVPLKMLPFDNKNEFQIVINMPDGSTLESTDRLVRQMESYLKEVDEIVNYHSYVGTAAPMDFNGMVRHYYLRNQGNVADIQVNLLPKEKRTQQSHNITLRLRNKLTELASKFGAKIEIVEAPPGPPVLATVVAEVYGQDNSSLAELTEGARLVESRFNKEPNLVDVDTTLMDKHKEFEFRINREKAALFDISTKQVNQLLKLVFDGSRAGSLHLDSERNPLNIICTVRDSLRTPPSQILNMKVRSATGKLVALSEIGDFFQIPAPEPIYHKNLKRVVFVNGEMAGRAPAEAILNLISHFKENPLPHNLKIDWAGEGEWKITLDVFRDLGLAFSAAMIGIYFLMVLETSSFLLPILIMLAIPLTAIGIMPGFWLLNLLVNQNIGGYDTPVFFTATGMIGMIALGGIVVRNSIVLIEFIQESIKEGLDLKEAIIQSGAVRFRPIMLTAGTTMLGAWPITLDPVFSGLAWSLIFGLFASTLFSLVIVPTVYFVIYKNKN